MRLFLVPGPQGDLDSGYSTMMMMMVGWVVVATALFLMRPRSLRQRGDQKPQGPQGVRYKSVKISVRRFNKTTILMTSVPAIGKSVTSKNEK